MTKPTKRAATRQQRAAKSVAAWEKKFRASNRASVKKDPVLAAKAKGMAARARARFPAKKKPAKKRK